MAAKSFLKRLDGEARLEVFVKSAEYIESRKSDYDTLTDPTRMGYNLCPVSECAESASREICDAGFQWLAGD